MKTAEDFLTGVQNLDKELISKSLTKEVKNDSSLFTQFQDANTKYGLVEKIDMQGFEVLKENNTKYIHFWAILKRREMDNLIDVNVDCVENKVVTYQF